MPTAETAAKQPKTTDDAGGSAPAGGGGSAPAPAGGSAPTDDKKKNMQLRWKRTRTMQLRILSPEVTPELRCSGFQPEADADHAATLSLAVGEAKRHAHGTTAVDHEPAAESQPAAEAESV